MAQKGRLYLTPTPIADDDTAWVGTDIKIILQGIKYVIAERARTARRAMKLMADDIDLTTIEVYELDKQDPSHNLTQYIAPLLRGQDMALMSEAGNPCIADPGSLVVELCHKHGIEVVPLVGPSSILMALISSGFQGQNFIFHGYLPHKKDGLVPRIKSIEAAIIKSGQTQLFMETPHGNQSLLSTLCTTLAPHLELCIACEIGSASQSIVRQDIKRWQGSDHGIYHKKRCIYVLGRN